MTKQAIKHFLAFGGKGGVGDPKRPTALFNIHEIHNGDDRRSRPVGMLITLDSGRLTSDDVLQAFDDLESELSGVDDKGKAKAQFTRREVRGDAGELVGCASYLKGENPVSVDIALRTHIQIAAAIHRTQQSNQAGGQRRLGNG